MQHIHAEIDTTYWPIALSPQFSNNICYSSVRKIQFSFRIESYRL